MITLKSLAPEIGASVSEIISACQILNIQLEQRNGEFLLTPSEEEGIRQLAIEALNNGMTLTEAATSVAKEVSQRNSHSTSNSKGNSTTEQQNAQKSDRFSRDVYNIGRFGTTEAPSGSVVGTFIADQIPAASFGQQRHALFMDYSTAVLNDLLIHGVETKENPTTPQSDIDKYRQVPQASTDILTELVVSAVNWGVGTAALGGTTTLPQLEQS